MSAPNKDVAKNFIETISILCEHMGCTWSVDEEKKEINFQPLVSIQSTTSND